MPRKTPTDEEVAAAEARIAARKDKKEGKPAPEPKKKKKKKGKKKKPSDKRGSFSEMMRERMRRAMGL